jgi:opacity protein-like surface antigen
MKPAAFTLMPVLFVAISAKAQLSFLPQLGFEQSKTLVQYNNSSSFSPIGSQANLKANLRMGYRFKKGHGPYMAVGTAPGAVAFSFNDVANAANNFKAAQNSLQWRLEAGYQYSSKPLNLKKASTKQAEKTVTQNTEVRSKCGSYYSYHRQERTATTAKKQDNNLSLRLQPSVGIAYLPSIKNDVVSTGSGYQYNAGNYKTALTSGMGFEFARGKQRLFTITAFYTKGLGSFDETITSIENNKDVNNLVSSNTSGWGVMAGVPFSFTKKQKVVFKPVTTQPSKTYRSKCQSYHGSCTRKI